MRCRTERRKAMLRRCCLGVALCAVAGLAQAAVLELREEPNGIRLIATSGGAYGPPATDIYTGVIALYGGPLLHEVITSGGYALSLLNNNVPKIFFRFDQAAEASYTYEPISVAGFVATPISGSWGSFSGGFRLFTRDPPAAPAPQRVGVTYYAQQSEGPPPSYGGSFDGLDVLFGGSFGGHGIIPGLTRVIESFDPPLTLKTVGTASLEVVLASDPASGTDITFTGAHAGSTVFAGDSAFGDFALDGATSSRLVTGLIGDVYTITAAPPPGWAVTAASCTGGSDAGVLDGNTLTVTLKPREALTCHFETAALATLTVVQDTQPNGPQDFGFSGDLGAFVLDDDTDATLDAAATFSLVPGSYTVAQGPVAGFALTAVECDDADSVGDPGTGSATILLAAAEVTTCTFRNTALYPITAIAAPPEGGAVACDPNPVAHGGTSTCTATANTGYTFTGFSGDCSGATCTLNNVTAARSVTANFSLNHYAITASASPAEGGSVTCTPNPVPHGGNSTCTASANTGYTFTGFSGDCSGTTCTLNNVTAARSVTANFSLNHYAITADASPAEGGSVTCTPDPVPHGSDSTCILAPAAGFRAATAVDGTCPAGTWQDATTYRVDTVTAACSVSFSFVLDGACGAAADSPTLTAPSSGLCAFGSPGPVTSADGTHTWSCAGDFGGSDAECSVLGAAPAGQPGNTVTLAVADSDGCTLDSAQLIAPPGDLPAGVVLPYGAVDFTLSGCTSATVTLTHAGPVDTQAFWKYVDGRWVDRMPVTLSGNQVQFTLADGSYWDSDPRTGFIADPGGVGTALAAVPALGLWALALLGGLLGALGLRRPLN